MAKKKAAGDVNKSEAIRAALAAHPRKKPKEIAALLREQGFVHGLRHTHCGHQHRVVVPPTNATPNPTKGPHHDRTHESPDGADVPVVR